MENITYSLTAGGKVLGWHILTSRPSSVPGLTKKSGFFRNFEPKLIQTVSY